MEEAQLQKFSPRLPADGTQHQEIKHEKKNTFEVVEHAMVHPQPVANVQAPPAACKGYSDTKGINPLYEYSRSKQGMEYQCGLNVCMTEIEIVHVHR